jgi:hypothetical protein
VAERKERMAVLSRYIKLHTARYSEKPSLNLNVEQWAADMLIESYGLPKCYDLLDYYFEAAEKPTWKFFANYAEKVLDSSNNIKQDIEERREMRRRAREWVNE